MHSLGSESQWHRKVVPWPKGSLLSPSCPLAYQLPVVGTEAATPPLVPGKLPPCREAEEYREPVPRHHQPSLCCVFALSVPSVHVCVHTCFSLTHL